MQTTSVSKKCGFWDVDHQQWSQAGCYFDPSQSTSSTTACSCQHLTSFSLMMDYTGEAQPWQVTLDTLTKVLLPTSITSLLACEIITMSRSVASLFLSNFPCRSNVRNGHRRLVESVRNLSLMLAQLSWLLLPGLPQWFDVGSFNCQVAGSAVHLAWMIFWTSTGENTLLFR